MALTQAQIQGLDAAAARRAANTASQTDIRNLQYAESRQGYKYSPTSPTVSIGQPQPSVAFGGSPIGTTASVNPVSREIQGLDAAAKRKAAGTASKTDLDNLAYATQRYGYTYQPGIGGKYTKGKPIPATGLGQNNPYAELSDLLGSQVTPDMISPEIAGLLALQGKTSDSEKQYNDFQGQLIEQMKAIGGQGEELKSQLDKQGVPQAFQQVKELNLRAAQLQGELENFDVATTQGQENVAGQAIPTGLIQGQQGQFQRQRDIARMGKAAEMSATIALSQAYQGNAELGMQLAQQAVDMKYQPILNNIEVLGKQLEFAGERMAKEDQKRAGIIGEMIDERRQKVAEAKDRENQIQQLAIDIASIGAPLDVVRRVQKMTDPVAAAQAAGTWKRQFDLAEEARQRSLKGDGTISSDYKLTSDQRSSLIGAGFSTEDIQNIQDNIKNGYTINDILNIPGLSDAQKKALGQTFTVPTTEEQFLNQDYFAKLYGGLGSSALKKAAKKAGFGGFLGGLTGVSTKEQKKFLASIEGKINQYRKAGYSDKEILKLMQK